MIALFASLPATIAAIVTLVTVLRGRGRATAAHDDLAAAVVHTHDAVARVAEEIAPTGTAPVVERVVSEGSE